MKVLFDTNIILDVLLNRKPFVELSSLVVGAVERNIIEGYLCATTFTTLDYLLTKTLHRNRAKVEIRKLLSLFQVAEVNAEVLTLSLDSDFKDFEDAVQYYAGERCCVDGLVTRNGKDYRRTNLPIYAPDELWGIISTNTPRTKGVSKTHK